MSVRLGIIGYGIMGERLLRAAMAHDPARISVAAVFDPLAGGAAASRLGFPRHHHRRQCRGADRGERLRLYRLASRQPSEAGARRNRSRQGGFLREAACDRSRGRPRLRARGCGCAFCGELPLRLLIRGGAIARLGRSGCGGHAAARRCRDRLRLNGHAPGSMTPSRGSTGQRKAASPARSFRISSSLTLRMLGDLHLADARASFPEPGRSNVRSAPISPCRVCPVALEGGVGITGKADHNTWTLKRRQGHDPPARLVLRRAAGSRERRFRRGAGCHSPTNRPAPSSSPRQLDKVAALTRGAAQDLATTR